MPTLRSRVEVKVTGTLANGLDLQSVAAQMAIRRAIDLANGVGAGQANTIWSDTRSLAPSTTEDLDLAGGGLVDALGVAFAPARVRGVLIYSAPSNLNNLTLFGDANSVPLLNTPATTVTLKPGGLYAFVDPSAAGVVVTAGTGDIIQVANAAGVNTVSYDIVIIGASS